MTMFLVFRIHECSKSKVLNETDMPFIKKSRILYRKNFLFKYIKASIGSESGIFLFKFNQIF